MFVLLKIFKIQNQVQWTIYSFIKKQWSTEACYNIDESHYITEKKLDEKVMYCMIPFR